MALHTQFIAALAKRPASTVVNGLRTGSGSDPDAGEFAAQHEQYLRALEDSGVSVMVLPADPGYPDSVFVEDTALCFADFAVVLRPGAPTRAGETASVAEALSAWYATIDHLEAGHVDGGDVLWTGREVLIGLSQRTDPVGAQALSDVLAAHGLTPRIVETPPGVLHFKSDSTSLDESTILATTRLDDSGVFDGYTVLAVPLGEEAAANAISINGRVLLPAGYPNTQAMLLDAGYDVVTVDNSQPQLIDGGLSCMSLRIPGN